ncbi:hypothetical protein WA026_015728 [Henosepilachna vigintioctopunctata]|uniref:Reverse transcriptase domain-containing protein n=1 Tax=Henosepilachna vigintioctopunctata TaxID=420089 RepID=A0AAW1URP5_9CUCU
MEPKKRNPRIVVFNVEPEFALSGNLIDDIIQAMQLGFRKGFSTTSAIVNIIDDIIEFLDQGLAVALILLEFSEAFDTIDHCLLRTKLLYFGFDIN